MAQRHRSLVPLARDHYEGLLLVQQIREPGRTMMVGWPAAENDRPGFVARFYDEKLRSHFKVEEDVLFTLVTRHVEPARSVIKELLSEHQRIEQFIVEFRQGDGIQKAQTLSEFTTYLEQHIRKEDRVLFPLIEEHAPAVVLNQIEESMNRFDQTGHDKARRTP